MSDEISYFQIYKELNPYQMTDSQLSLIQSNIESPSDIISDEYVDFRLWYQNQPSRQECFVKYLENYSGIHTDMKILEVGGGVQARASRILSKQGYHMTCVDPNVHLDSQDEVVCIKENFDYRYFDLKNYDYVIAQEPCDATEHIVRACYQHKIPFVIVLCASPHALISGIMPHNYQEWYAYLCKLTKHEAKLEYRELYPDTLSGILSYYPKKENIY